MIITRHSMGESVSTTRISSVIDMIDDFKMTFCNSIDFHVISKSLFTAMLLIMMEIIRVSMIML